MGTECQNHKSFITSIVLCVLLTAYCLLPAGFAQQPQTQAVQELFPVNAKYVQGFGPGYWPTAGSNLTLNLAPGTAVCSNIVITYAGGTLTLAPSATNYVYLNTSNNCVPASNTTGFSATTIPIATVVTNGTAISSITDDRTLFVSGGAGGSGSVTSVGMTGDGIIFSPTVSGSPITSNGTLAPQLLTQTANTVLAGPGSGQAATPTFRALAPGDLPATLFSSTTGNAATATALASPPTQCSSNNWATGISTSGNANCQQPGFGNLSGSLTLGQTPLTSAGDLIFANSAPALSRLPIGRTNQFLGISGGLPAWIQPTFGNVSGTAAISQGGTGQTTASSAFNALSPLTTEGDILYYHSSANTRLAKGANGQCLTSNGTDPVWGSCSTGNGTVTNVGLAMPSIFSVSGSPVTGSGTLTASLANQSANLFMAGPASGSAAVPTFRALIGADLPTPAASTLGGIKSVTCSTGQFLSQISTAGAPICAAATGGSSTGLGNGTTVIDASLQAGADFGSKINAAIAACPSNGCVIDARGLSGSQTLGENVLFSTANQPITILLAGMLTLTRASGMQIEVGTNGRLIGQGKASTIITGNDSTATVIGVNSGSAPSAIDIENLEISNSGIGPCIDFLDTSGGSLSANIHDNTFDCVTGILTTGYWNRIWNNTFNENPNSNFWAGTVLDDTPYGGQANSNHIFDNVYGGGGNGTGDYLNSGSGGYNNVYDGVQDYEGDNLAVFASSQASTLTLSGDDENVYCNGRAGWAANTAYGRGAVIWDGTNCEIDVTPDSAGYSTTSGSTVPSWPTTEGTKTSDGSVTWEMYSGNGVNGNSAFVVVNAGAKTNVVTGVIGLNPTIEDLDYIVNGATSNTISLYPNNRAGYAGTAPYYVPVGPQGINFTSGSDTRQPGYGQPIGSLNLNYFNPGNPTSIVNGASLDIPSGGNECSTYGYCGHLNLRLGSLYSMSGITTYGPNAFNQLPTPAAPTLTPMPAGYCTANPSLCSVVPHYLVAHINGGVTLPSAGSFATVITNPNSTNYNLIQVPSAIAGGTDPWSNATWDILKSNTSTSLYTNVRIGPGAAMDTGTSTSAYNAPTRNTTGDLTVAGLPTFFYLASGGPQCAQLSAAGSLSGTGSVCSPSVAIQTNGTNNTSQTTLNFSTSTTNAAGLIVTPVNSSGGVQRFEVTGGSYNGNAATATLATNFSGSLSGDVSGTQGATSVGKVNGASVPAGAPVVTNQSSQVVAIPNVLQPQLLANESGSCNNGYTNTDNTAGIQTAIAGFEGFSSGGSVTLPPCEFNVSTPIVFSNNAQDSAITIQGMATGFPKQPNAQSIGTWGTRIVGNGSNTDLIDVNATSITVRPGGITLKDLYLVGYGEAPTNGACIGSLGPADTTWVEHVRFTDCGYSVYATAGDYIQVRDSYSVNAGYGFYFNGGPFYWGRVEGSIATDSQYNGIYVSDTSGYHFSIIGNDVLRTCEADGCATSAHPANVYDASPDSIIAANRFSDPDANAGGISNVIIDAARIVVVGNEIGSSSINTGACGLVVTANASGSKIGPNTYYNNPTDICVQSGAADVTINEPHAVISDLGTRTVINGKSTNAGDPDASGVWQGVSKWGGLQIFDSASGLTYVYSDATHRTILPAFAISGSPSGTTSTVTYSQTFNAGNQSPLAGNWSIAAGGLALQLYSSAVTPTGINNAGTNNYLEYWNANAFPSNQTSTVTISAFADNQSKVGAAVRVAQGGLNGLNYYFGYCVGPAGTSTCTIAKFVNNTYSSLGTTSVTIALSDTIGLGVSGTTLTLYHNGTSVLSETDSSLTTGAPGIWVANNTLYHAGVSAWSGTFRATTIGAAAANNVATTTNTDNRGVITLSSGSGGYTFSQGPGASGAWTTAPVCVFFDVTNSTHQITPTVSVSGISLSGTAADVINYLCMPGN